MKLKEIGYPKEGIDQYLDEVKMSSYNHLLRISQDYVTFVFPKYMSIWDDEEQEFDMQFEEEELDGIED